MKFSWFLGVGMNGLIGIYKLRGSKMTRFGLIFETCPFYGQNAKIT